jgi:hypothetical protein
VEILRLFAHAVHAMILEVALDTSITGSFVACLGQFCTFASISHMRRNHHRISDKNDTHHTSSAPVGRQSMLSAPSYAAVSGGPLRLRRACGRWQASAGTSRRRFSVQQPCRRPGLRYTRAKETHRRRLGSSYYPFYSVQALGLARMPLSACAMGPRLVLRAAVSVCAWDVPSKTAQPMSLASAAGGVPAARFGVRSRVRWLLERVLPWHSDSSNDGHY